MNKIARSRLAAWMLAAILLLCCACGKEMETGTDSDGKVQTLDTAEEISAFIEKVYEEVGESNMPMMIEHRELDLADADALSYNTGLTSAEGVSRVVVSESMVGSVACSMLYITVADGTDAGGNPEEQVDGQHQPRQVDLRFGGKAGLGDAGQRYFLRQWALRRRWIRWWMPRC